MTRIYHVGCAIIGQTEEQHSFHYLPLNRVLGGVDCK